MRVLAAFFDPNDNGFDVTDAAILLTFIVALVTAVYGASRFAARQLREEITDVVNKRTQPLVSGYRNDGNSLTDISNRVETVIYRQGEIGREIGDLRESNDAMHQVLRTKVTEVAQRLDEHAASPTHDQRTHDTRSTDTQE